MVLEINDPSLQNEMKWISLFRGKKTLMHTDDSFGSVPVELYHELFDEVMLNVNPPFNAKL